MRNHTPAAPSSRMFAGLLVLLLPGFAAAHANFAENASGTREFKENARHFLRLNLAHTCGHGRDQSPIVNVALVFANGADAVVQEWQDATGTTKTPIAMADVASTWETPRDGEGNPLPPVEHGANAVMGIKAGIDRDWKRLVVHKGPVPTFYNHGVVEEDAVMLHWLGATVNGRAGMSNDFYDNLEFVIQFGKLKGCYTRLRVYAASIDFCAKGLVNAWMRAPTPMIDPAHHGNISMAAGYAPYVDIVRDTTTNPLPEACGGVGKTAEASPSAATIDEHLGALVTKHVQRKKASGDGGHHHH